MKLKPLSFLLVILMISVFIASCGSNNTGDTSTTNSGEQQVNAAETTAEAQVYYLDTIPKEDYDGATFTIFAQHMPTRPNFSIGELNGDILNDALYNRITDLEVRYNIDIIELGLEDRGQVRTNVSNAVMADDPAYDLVMTSMADGMSTLMPSGHLYNLNSLPTLDLSQQWWSQSCNENLQFSDKLYVTTGAITAFYYYTPMVMTFNTALSEDYGKTDIYNTVLDGKWTIDLLQSYMVDVAHDLNGDNVMDANDFYALMLDDEAGKALFVGSGGKLTEMNNDGYYLALDSDGNQRILDKLNGIFKDRNVVMYAQSITADNVKLFTESRALFCIITMGNVINDYRAMEDDYGIIPLPKADEAQTDYYTHGNPWGPAGVGVPITCRNPELTGLVMESLAFISYESVIPAIYEITLQEKIARDQNSKAMLDLIYRDIRFDLNSIYDFGGSSSLLRTYAVGVTDNFASSYAALSEKATTALQDIIDKQSAIN
jgi:hypothetical protein